MSAWEVVAAFATTGIVLVGIWLVLVAIVILALDAWDEWQAERTERIEAELDAQANRIRATILSLADDLATDRDEASKELTRAMFLTTGHTPTTKG